MVRSKNQIKKTHTSLSLTNLFEFVNLGNICYTFIIYKE